ncbi:hypothetical protein ZOSMA_450G00010 [Zostera marina]|uniref:F-box domain-containing protein n=1 Tax=Zostera marina TaxID=29655 RepID=A0A0K9P0T5_ZOSMR|nr:hypothetical protein ZOSMA_450G00010 [Zostera marina]
MAEIQLQQTETVTENFVGGFNVLPREIFIEILNSVADVRSLARCRCVNRRFASLIPQTETLLLKVDAVIPSQNDGDSFHLQIFPLLHRLVYSLLSMFFHPPPLWNPHMDDHSTPPFVLLRGFDRIRRLTIELPTGDPRLADKGSVLRWRAELGKNLRSCVILASRRMWSGGESAEIGEEEAVAVEEGLKERVIWTIGALIAASSRHHMVKELVKGGIGEGMEEVEVRDRDGEGVVIIETDGIQEWRDEVDVAVEEEDLGIVKGRTKLPAMRMRMRHCKRLDLGGGIAMEGAVLVIAKAVDDEDEEVLVRKAFHGVFKCAAKELMKKPSYVLDMNSF